MFKFFSDMKFALFDIIYKNFFILEIIQSRTL